MEKKKMPRYVVICDSTFDKEVVLYLVDRNKDNKRWWSRYLTNALILSSKEEAEKIAKTYLFNNTRILEI